MPLPFASVPQSQTPGVRPPPSSPRRRARPSFRAGSACRVRIRRCRCSGSLSSLTGGRSSLRERAMNHAVYEQSRMTHGAGSGDPYPLRGYPGAFPLQQRLKSYLPPKAAMCHLPAMVHLFLLAVLLLLSSCSQTSNPVTGGATPPPQATSPLRPTPTPPLITPTPPPLGPVPKDCPPGPTPQQIFSDLGPSGVGSYPVWAFGFDGPHATVPLSRDPDAYTPPYGWTTKVIWRVSTHYTHPVHLQGGNLRTGTSLWFQIGDQNPEPSPILDPRPAEQAIAESGDPNPPQAVGWRSYLYIPTAGCYYLEADWPGGSWRITFAAGRA